MSLRHAHPRDGARSVRMRLSTSIAVLVTACATVLPASAATPGAPDGPAASQVAGPNAPGSTPGALGTPDVPGPGPAPQDSAPDAALPSPTPDPSSPTPASPGPVASPVEPVPSVPGTGPAEPTGSATVPSSPPDPAQGTTSSPSSPTTPSPATPSNPVAAAAAEAVGALETVTATGAGIVVEGWAVDPSGGEAWADVTVDGFPWPIMATDVERTDIAARYPGTGALHGFRSTIRGTGPGVHEVCGWAWAGQQQRGDAVATALGCRQITVVLSRPPILTLEAVVATATGITVSGWAVDPDRAGPVVVVVGGGPVGGHLRTDVLRPDVAAAYPGTGDRQGFTATYAADPGTHRVCVTAIDDELLTYVPEQCRTVTIVDRAPTGNFESVTTSGSTVTLTGWALDPNKAGPATVTSTVNGVDAGSFVTDQPRGDVARVHPGLGGVHGFRHTFSPGPGTHTICLSVVNHGGLSPQSLGCRRLDGGPPPPDRPMIGTIDSVAVDGTRVTVSGWALDPDHARPVLLDLVVNGGFGGWVGTGISRPDVARAYPGTGTTQGFSRSFTAGPGTHRVCVGESYRPLLACRTFTVAAPPANRQPLGNFERLSATGSTVTLAGWALDPDTAAPVAVHFYVNGRWGGSVTADGVRSDIAAAFPGAGERHGFSRSFTAGPGTHEICAYVIDSTTSANAPMGCRRVTVNG